MSGWVDELNSFDLEILRIKYLNLHYIGFGSFRSVVHSCEWWSG